MPVLYFSHQATTPPASGMIITPLHYYLIGLLILALSGLFLLWYKIKKSHRKINKLKKKISILENKSVSKDKFFSIIAHDLKSPFNSLLGLSEMLTLHSETMDQGQIQSYSKMVHQSTTRLYALVDNLLQWSRTQLGTTGYKPEKLDISIITENIVNLLRISSQEKDIVIALNLEKELIAIADSNIFSAVLRNLINNAIKFSKVGSSITISGRKRPDRMIELEVKDKGIGMDAKKLESVFKLHSGESTLGTFNEKGTGLGLILCKEFVEINKGKINVESKPGEGTVVKFTIPSISYNMN